MHVLSCLICNNLDIYIKCEYLIILCNICIVSILVFITEIITEVFNYILTWTHNQAR